MTLARLLSDLATIVEFTAGDDPRGDGDAGTWADLETWPARFQQLSTAEALGGRDTATADWSVMLPGAAVIGPRSRVRNQDDQTFEVVGVPAHITRPGTGVHHIEVGLRVVV